MYYEIISSTGSKEPYVHHSHCQNGNSHINHLWYQWKMHLTEQKCLRNSQIVTLYLPLGYKLVITIITITVSVMAMEHQILHPQNHKQLPLHPKGAPPEYTKVELKYKLFRWSNIKLFAEAKSSLKTAKTIAINRFWHEKGQGSIFASVHAHTGTRMNDFPECHTAYFNTCRR